ncbi:MAG: nitric-oxide reductase large subunit [Bacteroidia bacterium]
MSRQKKLWILLFFVIGASFFVLGFFGYEIYQQAPPIPEKVVTTSGKILFTGQEIKDGQNVWQSMGGQEVGSIWGHGAYLAPDWTADRLHREAVIILDEWAIKMGTTSYKALDMEQQAALKARLNKELRTNTYNKVSSAITVSETRAYAIETLNGYYSGLFMADTTFNKLRSDYSIAKNTIKDIGLMRKMNAFLFWASWVCVTERLGSAISYTHNWPPDKLIGNVVTGDLVIWTGFSVIMLLVGIGILILYHTKTKVEGDLELPIEDPLMNQNLTPSMRAVEKYFWAINFLILIQVAMGIITAHYGVEGNSIYGFPLSTILPYSVTRTWHVQLSILWIATAWLATGLYIASSVSGKDPKFQKLGVNILFVSLLIIVAGSMIGEWFGIMQKLGLVENFWFGHQGYEYVDLGRFWQCFLFVGLLLWLTLMVRPLLPVIKRGTAEKGLLTLFLVSCTAIALFYGAGLMWGRQTNLSIAEYWKWWVVHLWVEGFFEVFATVVSAFLFVRLGLLKAATATANVFVASIIFLFAVILGLFHHLYFTGAPTMVIGLGATFSALEVVPLVLIGFEAFHNYRLSKAKEWLIDYKWPIYFLLSVSFWNFLGAGLFGFLINPPVALYYMQGLNTTALHSHTALFGVYGMLGIGLMLFVLRSLYRTQKWNTKLIGFSFWTLNIGLVLMSFMSLLPVGLLQTIASVNEGMWYARSSEFLHQPHMQTLRWLRIVGDIVFTVGIIALFIFVFSLKFKKGKLKTKH